MPTGDDWVEPPEEVIASGRVTTFRRRGDRIWRPHTANSRSVVQLLKHLEAKQFEGAPSLLAGDIEGGMEVSWLDGWVPEETESWRLGLSAIESVGALLRRYHECAAGFTPSGGFEEGPQSRARGLVVCHGDIAPRNTVFRDGQAAAFIDWDGIWIADPLWDLAHAVWQFGPICDVNDEWLRDYSDPLDLLARARALFRGYRLERHRAHGFGQRVVEVIAGCRLSVERKAAAGQPAFEATVREGMLDGLEQQQRVAESMKHELTCAAIESS